MVREGYKQTEVGEIPEDWEVLELRDFTVNGRLPSGLYKDQSLYGRGTQIIKLSDVFGLDVFDSDFVQRAEVTKSEILSYKVEVGDIFIALASVKLEGVGKVMLVRDLKEDTVFDHNVALIRLIKGIHSDFIFYFLKSNYIRNLVAQKATQVGTTFLKASSILTFCAFKPPFDEQIKIAKALSDVDELIVSLEKLIAKKRDIKTATMQQLLTGKKRLPGFGEGKGYKQTELDEIPEDWDVKSYGDIFDFFTTATNSRSDLSDKGSHYYIHYGDIHTEFDYVVDFDSSVIPRIQSEKISSASLLKDGDLLMADASEDYEGIGKSVEVRNLGVEKAVSGLHTFLLRDKDETFVDGYRGYLHTITCVKKSFDRLATGLKVYGLSKNNLKQVLIPIPSKDEQREIIAVLVSMREEIQCLCDRMEKTKAIKQGMMQELLTGRTRLIDVPVTEGVEEERMHGT